MYEKEGSQVATSICTRCLHKVSLVGWDDNTASWHHEVNGLDTCPNAPTVLADMESMRLADGVALVLEPWLLVDPGVANAADYLTAMDRHHAEELAKQKQRMAEQGYCVDSACTLPGTHSHQKPSTGLGTDDTHGDINGGLT